MKTKKKILTLIRDINYAYNDCTMYETIKNLLDEMVEELRPEYEYRVPKKPDKYAHCPLCGSDDGTNYDMGWELYDFCARCGQALDWTDHPWNSANHYGRLKWYPKDER